MIKVNISHILLLISVANIGVNAANILAMVPMPFLSHTMNFMPIFRELAIRGHNVTVVSPFPQKTPVPNLTDIVMPNVMEDFFKIMGPMTEMLKKDTVWHQLTAVWDFANSGTPTILATEQMQKIIKDTSDTKFDLIITEAWFIQEPFVAFGHKFNAPVINIMPAFFFPMAAHLSGNHLPVAYSPLNKLGFNDRMTFLQRAQNFFYYYWDVILGQLYYLRSQDAIMRKYFIYPGSENIPPLDVMLRNVSLTLLDYNPAISYPVPLQMNAIPFGGINAKPPEKLPADLQKFMDNAKDGVVYLSFGSFFSLSALKPHTRDALINALGKLKQKVLIKLEDPSILKNYPYANIETRSWLPQPSILAHPNCKIFITHGGIHGLMEGIYNTKPLLAVPLMADQKYNARFIDTAGIGIYMDRDTITEAKMLQAINDLINDPSYREKMVERSSIFMDTPIKTMDNVIYWIEYVIRYKGAPHLRPAVLDLHWYQYLMLDVITFYILIAVAILYIVKMILKFVFRCIKCVFCRKSCKKSDKKPKKD